MMKLARVLILLLFVAVPLEAQSPQSLSVPLTSTSSTCAVPSTACASVSVQGIVYVAVQLAGTFTATVTFEATVDGANWVALNLTPSNSATPASTATAVGVWSGNVGGYSQVRARVSAYTSGTVLTSLQAGR